MVSLHNKKWKIEVGICFRLIEYTVVSWKKGDLEVQLSINLLKSDFRIKY